VISLTQAIYLRTTHFCALFVFYIRATSGHRLTPIASADRRLAYEVSNAPKFLARAPISQEPNAACCREGLSGSPRRLTQMTSLRHDRCRVEERLNDYLR
jgi:hypothetical protein